MAWPPYGVIYVGSALINAGFQTKVYHFSVEQIDEYVERIIKENPILVGVSVMIDPIVDYIISFCNKLKSKSNIPIVWGRTHSSLVPLECLELDCVDYVVRGDGEEAMVDLAHAVRNKRLLRLKDILGLGYKHKKKNFLCKDRSFIKNLDKFSLNWDLIDVKKYIFSNKLIRSKRFFIFITSRGCIFNCSFCYNTKLNNRKWRSHSAEFVINNVRHIQEKYDIDTVRFVDDNFFVDKRRAFKILNNVNVNISLNCNITYLTENFVRELSKTKCVEIFLGIESGCDRILNLINKRITKKEIIKAIKLLDLVPNIKVIGSIIFNLPSENRDELTETIKLMSVLLKIRPGMEFRASKYIPQPGTPLFDKIAKDREEFCDGDWKFNSSKYHLAAGANPEILITNKNIDKIKSYLISG